MVARNIFSRDGSFCCVLAAPGRSASKFPAYSKKTSRKLFLIRTVVADKQGTISFRYDESGQIHFFDVIILSPLVMAFGEERGWIEVGGVSGGLRWSGVIGKHISFPLLCVVAASWLWD